MLRKSLMVFASVFAAVFAVGLAGVSTTHADDHTGATYSIDASHSSVGFKVRHFVAKVPGNFRTFTGTIQYDPAHPEKINIVGEIDVTSVDTANEDRDNHLRSPDFFDAENHPKITFKSTGAKKKGDDMIEVNGELTLRGVTKPVTLMVEILGVGQGFAGQVIGIEATGKINRKDFGMEWNKTLDAGGVVLGDEVEMLFSIEGAIMAEEASSGD